MRKRIVPIVLSLILFGASVRAEDAFQCPPEAKDSGQGPGTVVRWCEIEKDGRLLYHGPVWRWHPSGALASKESYVYGAAEGESQGWHENGKLSVRGVFRGGKKVGPWKYWDDQGALKTEVEYAEGGNHITHYHPNGTKKAAGVFVASGKIGKWTQWSADGTVTAECDLGRGVFALTTKPCEAIANDVEPKGFSRPIPAAVVNGDGTCSVAVAQQRYTLSVPDGWVADAGAAKDEGVPIVFHPRGGTWRGDGPSIYVRVMFKGGDSFATVVKNESESFGENVAEYSETEMKEERLPNGVLVGTRDITYKPLIETDSPFAIVGDSTIRESLAFVDATAEVVALIVLTSPTAEGRAASTAAWSSLTRSFRVSSR